MISLDNTQNRTLGRGRGHGADSWRWWSAPTMRYDGNTHGFCAGTAYEPEYWVDSQNNLRYGRGGGSGAGQGSGSGHTYDCHLDLLEVG